MANLVKPSGLSQIWAATGVSVAPDSSKISQGWVVELPPYQTANFVENRQDSFNAHVNQHGIPVWDRETEYQGGYSYVKGGDGVVYKCLATNIDVDPENPLNSFYWTKAFEDFGTVAVVAQQVSSHLTDYQTLAGIGNLAAARSNLNVYSKQEADARFAMRSGSVETTFAVAPATRPEHAVRFDQLATLVPPASEGQAGIVRVATTQEASTGSNDSVFISPLKGAQTYLRRSLNLSDLANVATARANLGLGTMALQNAGDYLTKASNLSDVPNKATARTNLGLGTAALRQEAFFLRSASNFADVPNKATARANLGLGGAALLDVGTAANTVAAGNDPRIVQAANVSRTITAGNGLTGGGSLGADRTITLGTPSSITATSTNTTTANSHTHAINLASFFTNQSLEETGHCILPGGLCLQWGLVEEGYVSSVSITFPITFRRVFNVQLTHRGTYPQTYTAQGLNNTGFTSLRNGAAQHWVYWFAIGRV